MGKRTDEQPYRPLDAALVQAVMSGAPAVQEESSLTGLTHTAPQAPSVEEGRGRSVARFQVSDHSRPIPRRPPRVTELASPIAERMEREKRVLLTPSEERALNRVVANIGAELGASLNLSHVLRSCIRLLINAEDELIERARATGRTIRPPNSDLTAIEAFEKVVANVLQSGIRGARPIR